MDPFRPVVLCTVLALALPAQEEVALLEQQIEIAQQLFTHAESLVELASKRVAEGVGSPGDLADAQLAAVDGQLQLLSLQQEFALLNGDSDGRVRGLSDAKIAAALAAVDTLTRNREHIRQLFAAGAASSHAVVEAEAARLQGQLRVLDMRRERAELESRAVRLVRLGKYIEAQIEIAEKLTEQSERRVSSAANLYAAGRLSSAELMGRKLELADARIQVLGLQRELAAIDPVPSARRRGRQLLEEQLAVASETVETCQQRFEQIRTLHEAGRATIADLTAGQEKVLRARMRELDLRRGRVQ